MLETLVGDNPFIERLFNCLLAGVVIMLFFDLINILSKGSATKTAIWNS